MSTEQTEDYLTTSDSPWTPEPPYQSYWEFRTYLQILRYGTGFIVILGVVGNILTLVVLQGRAYKSSPSNIIISALAVSDLGYIVCGLTRHWIIGLTDFRLDIRNMNTASCRLQTFFTYQFKHSSAILLSIITIERVCAVLYPLRFKDWFTRKSLITTVAVMSVLIAGCNGFYLEVMELTPGARVPCSRRKSWDLFYYNIYYWIDALLSNILPFILILGGNVMIIYKLAKARSHRKNTMQVLEQKNNSTTIMLIAVGLMFLVTTTPKAVYYFGFGYRVWPMETNQEWARIYLAYIITTLLVFVNSAVNFILYCLTGSRFRAAFFATFGFLRIKKEKQDHEEPDSGTRGTAATVASLPDYSEQAMNC